VGWREVASAEVSGESRSWREKGKLPMVACARNPIDIHLTHQLFVHLSSSTVALSSGVD